MTTAPESISYPEAIGRLQDDADSIQTKIYVVAGVLGGVCAALIITIIILVIAIRKLNKKILEAEESRRIHDEINARKFSAYTGEEVNRRLQTAAPTKTEGEYAFNYPASEYQLHVPAGRK